MEPAPELLATLTGLARLPRVPAQTTPVAGTYRDTVNVTISW